MSRKNVFVIIGILLMFLASCAPAQASKPNVLILLQENSDSAYNLTKEVGVMASMLEKAGFNVVYASSSGKTMVLGDVTLTPDLKFTDVNVEDYAGFVLPCMAVGGIRTSDPVENKILADASAAGKPIAAQSGGVITLGFAGVLDGKQFAAADVDAKFIHAGKFMGMGIIQDGIILTSGVCPTGEQYGFGKDETTGLMEKFIEAVKVAS